MQRRNKKWRESERGREKILEKRKTDYCKKKELTEVKKDEKDS